MSYTASSIQTNVYDMKNELHSTILSYLLQDQIVMLDSDMVPENYLESLLENIRDDLYGLVERGEIGKNRYQNILAKLVTKTSIDGMESAFIQPTIIIRIRMFASVEKC